MAFPQPHTAWPPEKFAPVTRMVGDAAMWWEGDTAQLSSAYHAQYKPSQFAGGVVGAVSRWFWGSPQQTQVRRVHMPLAADIASTSGTLLFDRAPVFSHPDGDIQSHIDDLLDPGTFPADLRVAGESCAALGAVGWRVMWDTDISDHPWVDWVDADAVYPTFSYGRLQSVLFCEQLPAHGDKKYVYRLFTDHTRGRIDYRLMEGTATDVGRIVPLTDHPTAAPLADHVDAGGGQDTGIRVMTAGYIPNAKPVVGFRKDGQLRHIGRPDLTPDLYPMFDALDEVWTEIRAEIRLSRKKIIVPDWMLDTHGIGTGQYFDNDREVFSPVRGRPDSNQGVEVYAPSLRIDAMVDAATAWTEKIIQRANYSPASFGLDTSGTGGVTAREIEARYDASLKTWAAKATYFKTGLKALATALIQMDRTIHGYNPDVEPPRVDMERPVQETPLDRAQTIKELDLARSVSLETRVGMQWPEWDDDMKSQEVARIKAEQAGAMDPMFAPDENPLLDLPDETGGGDSRLTT